jgi:hypothetical protein
MPRRATPIDPSNTRDFIIRVLQRLIQRKNTMSLFHDQIPTKQKIFFTNLSFLRIYLYITGEGTESIGRHLASTEGSL